MSIVATATRADDWWAVEVEGHPGVYTQARRLELIPAMVADAIQTLTGESVDPADVQVRPMLSEDLDQALVEFMERRERVRAAEAELSRASRLMARALVVDRKLSTRDAGTVLGLSHQRVAQLVAD